MAYNFETASTSIMDLANTIDLGRAKNLANQAATDGQDFWFSFLGINWGLPTWDILVLVIFILGALLYFFTLGRDRIVAVLVSTYLALAVVTNLPFLNQLLKIASSSGGNSFQNYIYLIAFLLLFAILAFSPLARDLGNFFGNWWQVLIYTLLQVGLLFSIILSFLPNQAINQLSRFNQIIFLSDIGKFCWLILPIIALLIIRSGLPMRFNFRNRF